MDIIDISMPVHEGMQVYKNRKEKRPTIEVTSDFSGGSVYESRICLDLHTGTHIDAPLHMIEGGGDVGVYSKKDFINSARLLDFSHVEGGIERADLEKKEILPGEFVLLKTKNSFSENFNFDFVYLAESGARYLAEKLVTGVGIDSLGIERAQKGHETHKILLNKRIIILEGLRLKGVSEGLYTLFIAPLNILGVEALPVRAFLSTSVRL